MTHALIRMPVGIVTLFEQESALAPNGTPFQQRLWTRIAGIPFGLTLIYGELARVVGSAPRAVRVACARNPLPIFITCHRLLGGRGRMTGYPGAEGFGDQAPTPASAGHHVDLVPSRRSPRSFIRLVHPH